MCRWGGGSVKRHDFFKHKLCIWQHSISVKTLDPPDSDPLGLGIGQLLLIEFITVRRGKALLCMSLGHTWLDKAESLCELSSAASWTDYWVLQSACTLTT